MKNKLNNNLSFNEQYKRLAEEILNDVMYSSDQSYRGKIRGLRHYAEIIIRKLIGRNQNSKLTLGEKGLTQAIESMPDHEFIKGAVNIIHDLGNKATHTEYTEEFNEKDYKKAVDAVFNLLAALLINYFAKNEFGQVPYILYDFSLLPPIIRLRILNYLYENPKNSNNITAKNGKNNMALIDKLVLAMLKAQGQETAVEWIENHKETLKNLRTLDGLTMYYVCLEKTKLLGQKEVLYSTFEEAKAENVRFFV